MVLQMHYPFCRLTFWLVEGNVWVLLTQKGLNMYQWNYCVDRKGRKKNNPHWFDFHGLPTPWSTLVSLPYKNTIKYQIKAATVIKELGFQRIVYSRWGGTERERQKETGREQRGWTSVCPGSAQTLVSHWIYLCSFVGAKYNSMGLLTFQYFSLTSSREKEPFKTCEGKWTLSYWGKACVFLKQSQFDCLNMIVWLYCAALDKVTPNLLWTGCLL